MYKLDRTAFAIQTFEEASNQVGYWLTKTPTERLNAAWYLICAAWNLDMKEPIKMDRSQFSMRKRS